MISLRFNRAFAIILITNVITLQNRYYLAIRDETKDYILGL